MIKIFKCSDVSLEEILYRKEEEESKTAAEAVEIILKEVRTRGDEAVRQYTRIFDGSDLTDFSVKQDEIDAAYDRIEDSFKEVLLLAAKNIEEFHRKQLKSGFIMTRDEGVILGQKITPIEKVGTYVPGGTASYPSTVLMDAIPARLAGVKEIVMTTPCGKDGKVPDPILAAAKIAGVTSIFKIGGAQAIGALAYGTKSIPKVDKIVGPGNMYVAAAKRQVFGLVDIDMIAGPSEILIIADSTANPAYIAADMLSQAEHDKMSASVLICDSEELADNVSKELEIQLKTLPRREIAKVSIDNNGKIIIAGSLNEAIEISNAIAPEHLEIATENPFEYLPKIKNAGSIFLGKNVPEALGDYMAGPNHTLPTMGTARFSSPLSVDSFTKRSSFIYYDEAALEKISESVVEFAEKEQLTAHGRSVSIRMKG